MWITWLFSPILNPGFSPCADAVIASDVKLTFLIAAKLGCWNNPVAVAGLIGGNTGPINAVAVTTFALIVAPVPAAIVG